MNNYMKITKLVKDDKSENSMNLQIYIYIYENHMKVTGNMIQGSFLTDG